jgi:parallel beta helix pectate lyase-like protein
MRNAVSTRGPSALLLYLVSVLAPAQAADLYVSTQGSDSNPGTSEQPFRTIAQAYGLAGPGVTIYVMPGVYDEYDSGWGIHLGASGTASRPIVLESQVRGKAIIDGQNTSDRNVGFYIDGSYNVIDGFEIRNCPNGGITIWGDGNEILNNEIHHNGNPDSSSTNGRDGVYSNEGTTDNFYAANSIHDNGRAGSNLDHGLYLCGQNETVINNLLFRNAATGLQVAGYTTVSNMKVYNNVMAWNGTDGIILWLDLSGVDIRNNILYQNGHYGLGSYDGHGSDVVVDHNLSYGNGYGDFDYTSGGSDYSYTQGTTIFADPLFVNEASGDFDAHLGNGSPAIRAGLNLRSVFGTDKDGWARPTTDAWDLGVYGSVRTPPIMSHLSFAAASGTVTSPFYFSNDAIVQPDYTSVAAGGQAVYTFRISMAGDYVVSALVNAPSLDNNSFFVNIDDQPTDPLMIWDIPVTVGPSMETVTWRGIGGQDPASPSGFNAQYTPQVFNLSAGTHQLIVRGREGNCELGEITIASAALP